MRRIRPIPVCLFLLSIISVSDPSYAHDPGLSFAEVRIGATETVATLAFARRELEPLIAIDADGDGAASGPELDAARPRLRDFAPQLFTIRTGAPDVQPAVASIEIDDSDAVRIVLRYAVGASSAVRLEAPIIARLARGHRQYLSVKTADDRPLADRILDAGAPRFTVAVRDAGAWTGNSFQQFATFVREGVRHIWIGFDHVLFLVTLLLPVVLCRRAGVWQGVDRIGAAVRQVLMVVTAFTIAHSVTLSLAVLDVVDLPPRLTESVIAASVVIAAFNNLWPIVTRRLWAVAFAFGLVHGVGFAGALTDLGLPRGSETTALLGFNLGVEFGQLAIVAAVLPVIYLLRQTALYRRGALQLGSLSIAIIATVWLIERAFRLVIIPT